ncbi:MAG TPA: hypothetical protein DD670_00730 [Planctomycetaceae bacterium]|nr:hypothetical protein [Planctomycetaceae bacterium]
MAPILRYGADSSLILDSCEDALLGQCGVPDVAPVADIRAELRRALAAPLGYPPFSAVITPGDRVVLTLADDVPGLPDLVAAIIESLVEGRVDPEAITVLRSSRAVNQDPCRALPKTLRSQVVSLCHTGEEPDRLAYLAATEDGHAVMLHRAIVDADLVIPIGCFRGSAAAGYHGLHTPIYPAFSNDETLRRFRSTATLDARGRHRKRLTQEADEVGWLLGIAFTIQVMPASGDRVHEILAGDVDAVGHRGMRLFSELWHQRTARPAGLVLAALEGNSAHQTWENLGRALEAATPLVEEGGALALCTELAELPGVAVQCLKKARSRDEAVGRIQRDEAYDAVTALQLARALDHCSIYLLSKLENSLVEDLEMTPVDEASDLARLAGRFESVLLLGNASYTRVTVESDDEA